MEEEVLVACGTPEHGLPPLVVHVSIRCCLGVSSDTCCTGATNHAEVVAGGGQGMFRVVLPPHPAYTGLVSGLGLRIDGLLCGSGR